VLFRSTNPILKRNFTLGCADVRQRLTFAQQQLILLNLQLKTKLIKTLSFLFSYIIILNTDMKTSATTHFPTLPQL